MSFEIRRCIYNPAHEAKPAQSAFSEHYVRDQEVSAGSDLGVWHFVAPVDNENTKLADCKLLGDFQSRLCPSKVRFHIYVLKWAILTEVIFLSFYVLEDNKAFRKWEGTCFYLLQL